MDQTTFSDTELVAELNDLLQLDHDAVSAYTLAIGALNNDGYKEAVRRFRADHERHIVDLAHLVHIHHGEPAHTAHEPAGVFKLAVEAVGAARGDTALLIAFKANERQSRAKYVKAAANSFPAEIAAVLRRAADDEGRHYAWATSVLEKLGIDDSSVTGRAERALETVHAGMMNAVEDAEKGALKMANGARRAMKTKKGVATLVGSALAVIGAGAVAAYLIKKR